MNKCYNDEPVFYCKECLSLNIQTIPDFDVDYCAECSSTNIGKTHIDKWNKLYKDKYGKTLIEQEKLWKKKRKKNSATNN